MEWLLVRAVCIALLILANGFFVAAEFALVSLRETRLREMLAQGRTGARAVEHLQDHLDDFLPAVQFGVTLASLALGWLGEPFIARTLEHSFATLPHAEVYAHIAALALAFCFITYFHVLLGELVPKSLALQRVERVALAVAPPMEVFISITRPAVRILNRSAAWVLRLFRVSLANETGTHSPEELKLLATASRRGGLLPPAQERVIHQALEFHHVQVREIMTPRGRIFSLPADMPVEQASARITEEQHSRVPVFDPALGPEQILGVVYAKDVARLMHFRLTAFARFGQPPQTEIHLQQIMKDVLIVPETKPVADMLREFQQLRRHMAIVVDEFGTTAGIVTVEDALEQLVGEMDDEFDLTAVPALNLRGPITVDGSTSLRDLAVQTGIELPREEGFETLAGFMLWRLGSIPQVGEEVTEVGRVFRVSEMQGHRVAKVRIERETPADTSTKPQQLSLSTMNEGLRK